MDKEEVKSGREYTFKETTIEHLINLKSGDMLIFRKDFNEKSWEIFKSFIGGSPSFITEHKIDQPGGPSWNESAKFFLREFAWAAGNILNTKQIRIIRLKNRLKRKVINLPVECVLARMEKK